MGKNETPRFHALHINNHKDHAATQQTNKEFRCWLLDSLVLHTISHKGAEVTAKLGDQTNSLLCTIPHAMLT